MGKTPRLRLRVLRAERRINQLDTAKRIGISHARYWRIENGYAEARTIELARLARLFRVGIDDLYERRSA